MGGIGEFYRQNFLDEVLSLPKDVERWSDFALLGIDGEVIGRAKLLLVSAFARNPELIGLIPKTSAMTVALICEGRGSMG